MKDKFDQTLAVGDFVIAGFTDRYKDIEPWSAVGKVVHFGTKRIHIKPLSESFSWDVYGATTTKRGKVYALISDHMIKTTEDTVRPILETAMLDRLGA